MLFKKRQYPDNYNCQGTVSFLTSDNPEIIKYIFNIHKSITGN